ncbi:mitochondrial carrier [Trichodelitschia bisporula]|uniref:Mitochondrial carrier n=1 Tax=Trichodelitschia bisporula TaxID=703511 RepID=A0A6G1I4V4_9PEZI|nr:mitochondrial carrier [Trichodelitschia bisporula]
MERDSGPYASFRTSTSRDAPNPLRPYYIPPSIGPPPEPLANVTQHAAATKIPPPSSKPDLRSSARDLLSDLDYETYLPEKDSGSLADVTKRLLDQAVWNYTSILLAQPFEVAKIVLQCHLAGGTESLPVPTHANGQQSYAAYGDNRVSDYLSEEDSDSEAPSYFASTAPYETPSSPRSTRRRNPPNRSHSATPTPSSQHFAHAIELRRSDSLLEVISQLWSKEGAWGIWKGTNSTFVYNVLLKTIETWTRSLLSALMNLPDAGLVGHSAHAAHLGGPHILDSPSPLASIGVVVAAAGIAGLLLAPLDMVRTRLILTSTSSPPRALLPSLRSLPSRTVPPALVPITLLHSTLPPLLSSCAPFFLRSWLHIDPTLTPLTYSLSSFCTSLSELFLKLPLETVLRRGHIAVLSQPTPKRAMGILPSNEVPAGPLRTIVPVGPYRGVWGTVWYIVREEGYSRPQNGVAALGTSTPVGIQSGRQTPVSAGGMGAMLPPPRRGQGVKGLWRGWRVGFWGLVGVWGAGALGGAGGGEF